MELENGKWKNATEIVKQKARRGSSATKNIEGSHKKIEQWQKPPKKISQPLLEDVMVLKSRFSKQGHLDMRGTTSKNRKKITGKNYSDQKAETYEIKQVHKGKGLVGG